VNREFSYFSQSTTFGSNFWFGHFKGKLFSFQALKKEIKRKRIATHTNRTENK
jgi:hypothetical protein